MKPTNDREWSEYIACMQYDLDTYRYEQLPLIKDAFSDLCESRAGSPTLGAALDRAGALLEEASVLLEQVTTDLEHDIADMGEELSAETQDHGAILCGELKGFSDDMQRLDGELRRLRAHVRANECLVQVEQGMSGLSMN